VKSTYSDYGQHIVLFTTPPMYILTDILNVLLSVVQPTEKEAVIDKEVKGKIFLFGQYNNYVFGRFP